MGSISNLAVVISGHTKPLEDAMKRAQAKVSSFGGSFAGAMGKGIAGGLGLGLAVAGLDKMEQAMKSAVADTPRLAEAAERAEKGFGNILLKVTGMNYLMPKMADTIESIADWMEGITPEMKKQQELQANILKAERALADVRIEGLAAVTKTLEAQMDAIDPMREQLAIAEQLKPENDPYLSKNLSLAQMAKPGYDPFAREKASAMKAEIDEHNRVMQAMDEEIAKIDEEKEAYAEWIKMYEDTIKELDKYQESFGPITAEQAALEKRNDLIAEARKLMEEQVPVIDKLRARYEEAAAAGLTGSELAAFKKAYDEATAKQNAAKATTNKLSGAVTAGSQEAYSIITKAQVDQGDKQVTELKALGKEARSQTSAINKLADQPFWRSTFAANVHLMKL